MTGRIYAKKNVGEDYRVLAAPHEATGPDVKHMLTKDFYKELRLRGYQYRLNILFTNNNQLYVTTEGEPTLS